VCDFGLARRAERWTSADSWKMPLRWVPPEVLDSERRVWTEKSDVWAFGVTMWEVRFKGLGGPL